MHVQVLRLVCETKYIRKRKRPRIFTPKTEEWIWKKNKSFSFSAVILAATGKTRCHFQHKVKTEIGRGDWLILRNIKKSYLKPFSTLNGGSVGTRVDGGGRAVAVVVMPTVLLLMLLLVTCSWTCRHQGTRGGTGWHQRRRWMNSRQWRHTTRRSA